MTVSSARFASQLVAPGEEPRFFDDLGCLAAYLGEHASLPPGAIAYVADHRSGEWVPAATAVYTRVPGLETPMGSHVVAHASAASRDGDPAATGGTAVDAACLLHPDAAGRVAMTAVSTFRAIRLCARQELVLAFRSRWTQTFAVAFAVLALAVAVSGYILSGGSGVQDFSRTAASLVQLVLLLVPLTALLLGVLALASDRGNAELLFSQPVPRAAILFGRVAGPVPGAGLRAGHRVRRRGRGDLLAGRRRRRRGLPRGGRRGVRADGRLPGPGRPHRGRQHRQAAVPGARDRAGGLAGARRAGGPGGARRRVAAPVRRGLAPPDHRRHRQSGRRRPNRRRCCSSRARPPSARRRWRCCGSPEGPWARPCCWPPRSCCGWRCRSGPPPGASRAPISERAGQYRKR